VNLLPFNLAAAASIMTLLFPGIAAGQGPDGDKVDLAALTQIKNESFQRSQVMENFFFISEVFGPRVNNGRNHRAAAQWAIQRMKEWGLQMSTWRRGGRSATAGRSRSTMGRWRRQHMPT
jgi:carboxypeptidase Q